MASFAELDEGNIVKRVIAVVNDVILDEEGNESEQKGIDFLTSLYNGGTWLQTSYNGNIRANYAGIGYTYDPDFDIFIAPRPYPSWKLNYTIHQWEAPVAKPEDVEEFFWKWSEINKEWIQIAIPSIDS